MSSVRMCDRDGEIFSERAEGWSTYTGVIRRREEKTGKLITVEQTLDACPTCTELMTGSETAPEPVALTGTQRRYEPGAQPLTGTVVQPGAAAGGQ